MKSLAPLILSAMTAASPAFAQSSIETHAPTIRTQAQQTEAQIKSIIRRQLLLNYELRHKPYTTRGGTIRECDPLRSLARNIHQTLNIYQFKEANLLLQPELIGLQGSLLLRFEGNEETLNGKISEDEIYNLLHKRSEEFVSQILDQAKEKPYLMKLLKARKRFSIPNCATSQFTLPLPHHHV